MSETPNGFGETADDPTPSGSSSAKPPLELVAVNLIVNGQRRTMTIEPRGKRIRDLPVTVEKLM